MGSLICVGEFDGITAANGDGFGRELEVLLVDDDGLGLATVFDNRLSANGDNGFGELAGFGLFDVVAGVAPGARHVRLITDKTFDFPVLRFRAVLIHYDQ
jgi:hypothetical protein